MRSVLTFALTALALSLFLAPEAALAQRGADSGSRIAFRGWGPRAGMSFDPDQVHFGAHIDFGNFARRVRFQPNVEVGIGDDWTVIAFNGEAAYRFPAQGNAWALYAGGGLGLNFVSFDNGFVDGSDTDLSLNVLGGVEKPLSSGNRFFLEGKFSLNEGPDAKITAGLTFYR